MGEDRTRERTGRGRELQTGCTHVGTGGVVSGDGIGARTGGGHKGEMPALRDSPSVTVAIPLKIDEHEPTILRR